MMNQALPWLMAIGMGVYQGVNPPVGWLRAVARGLETNSTRAILLSTAALAFGHFLSMIVLLAPVSVVIAVLLADRLSMMTLMQAGSLAGFGLIGFGLYKILRPRHPKFLARISPDRPVRWAFCMGLTHCGSPVMMAPMLINLILVSAWVAAPSTVAPIFGAVLIALAVSAAMAVPLFLTGSAVAIAVVRRFGLRAITRYWVNLDLGWAVMFILMGIMGLTMG
ncbi:hypothetical protein AiwAL_02200 [Acidiphilium sp. AL]|uniref:Urease accessory protein UreH-like transmembrane domain-containing protein n=2 Tax=Acidiphilium iwatense TaxID=768198 RepID=A0ABS9DRV6_9PROT|nr:hypothetical protein [Acidiphilium sp. AL]MCF3945399.1 hypothetical protein [Acidiphilium iwatense]MCU4158915.1 hypothetical protein [Acidiphilium sp. AL]